ncbi:MAG: DUF975 family protein [Christensenellales bacterium]
MEREKYNFFKTIQELVEESKEGLIGNKGSSLVVNLIYFLSKAVFFCSIGLLICALVNINNPAFNLQLFLVLGLCFLFVSVLTYGPLRVGVCKNSLNMINNTKPSAKDVLFGFKNKYFRHVWFGICLFFAYLFNLVLLIFPFFLRYFSFQVAGFVLAEDLQISATGALKQSSLISKGYRKTYIKIFLKFVPQMLLCLATLYIYSLWLRPKFNTTVCAYYLDIKN